MSYIRVTDTDKSELMKEISSITQSGERVLNFIEKNPLLIAKDEYVRKELVHNLPRAAFGLVTMNAKYSINLKTTTIATVAFLLDLHLTSGAASLLLNLSGDLKALYKIQETERCLILDILTNEKKQSIDFDYNSKPCIQTDIKCPFRQKNICDRKLDEIEKNLSNLLIQKIIIKTDIYMANPI